MKVRQGRIVCNLRGLSEMLRFWEQTTGEDSCWVSAYETPRNHHLLEGHLEFGAGQTQRPHGSPLGFSVALISVTAHLLLTDSPSTASALRH